MSQTDIDPDTATMLREKLQNDPESLVRLYPDKARQWARKARREGYHELADDIEDLVADIQAEGSS